MHIETTMFVNLSQKKSTVTNEEQNEQNQLELFLLV